MNNSLITILITSYNKSKYIGYILNMLLEQNQSEIQVIIIDDGSTDNSVEIIRTLIKNIPNFHLHRWKVNKGIAYARQYALKIVQTPYFIFIDADDMIVENYVQLLLNSVHNDNISNVHVFKARIYPIGKVSNLHISLTTKLIKTSFIKQYSIHFTPNLNYLEDEAFIQKMLVYKNTFHFYDEILYIYNISTDNSISREKGVWWNELQYMDIEHYCNSL